MKKQLDFLDDPSLEPCEPHEAELAALYREVSNLEEPDPGQSYWNHFNHRLQNRIDRLPVKTSIWIWFRAPLWAGAALVFALAFLFWPNAQPSPSLENLDAEELQILAQLYEPAEDELAFDLADSEVDLLLDIYEPVSAGPFDEEDFVEVSPEEFKALWNLEG